MCQYIEVMEREMKQRKGEEKMTQQESFQFKSELEQDLEQAPTLESSQFEDSLFGDVIHSYTRAQAIEDGVLIDVSDSKAYKESGIKFPVAMTTSIWELVSPERMPCGNSIDGRLWDLLYMFRMAARRFSGDTLYYKCIFSHEGPRGGFKQKTYTIKALCGPGDNMEPVITLMLPNED